ncbi:ubiquitin-like protein modifier (nucleomorph) [Bigelowiella natans]|uniref:Ubiquitin-like protein modifier n=1 Tax=Bigelowiella natans TaxID=227086 RepID=Q3LW92_BIGNA|nr:ubiquitin-like protein modifier [Bigelowiella natans]ABA27274.1 ubiquitin-like protein modifier [Bigelowiella natans]
MSELLIWITNKMGEKFQIICKSTDTVLELKKIIALYRNTDWRRMNLIKNSVYLIDFLTLEDYEINNESCIECVDSLNM